MRFKIILSLLLSLSAAMGMAQDVASGADSTIRGRVLSEDGHPIEYANVVLLTPDTVYVGGTVTSESGEFRFQSTPTVSKGYILRISGVGYDTVELASSGDNAGDIRMSSRSSMLSEVVVTPPTYKMNGNGLMVSVQNTALSHLGDVSKMLQYIPGLQSNSEGLYVFGKGKPLIYLNGRILTDTSELDRLQASDIATVEVITNPGAEYSASSRAVVKIRTIRKTGEGFGISSRTYAQLAHRYRLGETVQANYRSDKLEIFAYLNYTHAEDYSTEKSLYDVVSDNPFNINYDMSKLIIRNQYTGKVGFDYSLAPEHNIGAYYSYTYYDNKSDWDETASTRGAGQTPDSQTYYVKNDITSPHHRVNAYYAGRIESVDVNFNNDFYTADNSQGQLVDGYSDTYGPQSASTRNARKNRIVASDLSLTYKFGKSTWKAGTAYNHAFSANNYASEGGIEIAHKQKITENIWALYAQYGLMIDKWEFDAGLRYEFYKYDFFKNGEHIDAQSKIYNNVYPNLLLSREVGNVNLNLSYSMKSVKPAYGVLDGNVQYMTRNLYKGGNALLKPSTFNDIQLSMFYKGLRVSADYIAVKNPMYYTYTFYEGNQSIILASYDNYPKVNIFQGAVSYSKKIGIWEPQLSVDFMRGDYKFEQAGKTYRQDSPLFTFNFDHTFSLPHNWFIYVFMFYQTKGCNEEGLRLKDSGRLSLDIVKEWKNLSVEVLFNDLTRSSKTAYSAIAPACTYHTSRYDDTRNIQIVVQYKFNTTRSKYKGKDAAADIINRM